MRPHLDHLLQNGVDDLADGSLAPAELLGYLPSPERELLYWLCDAMAEVAQYEASNKMHVGAIAVVLAPNLLPCAPDADPMAALLHTQTSVKFMNTLLATYRG